MSCDFENDRIFVIGFENDAIFVIGISPESKKPNPPHTLHTFDINNHSLFIYDIDNHLKAMSNDYYYHLHLI